MITYAIGLLMGFRSIIRTSSDKAGVTFNDKITMAVTGGGGRANGYLFIISLCLLMMMNSITKTVSGQESARELTSLERLIGEGTRVNITPSVVKRDLFYTFGIAIILGNEGLSPDDSFGIVNGSNIDRWHFGFPEHFWTQQVCWQVDDPGAFNYTTASCSREDARIKLNVGKYGKTRPYANEPGHFVRSLKERMRYVLELETDTRLGEGDTIFIKWGVSTRREVCRPPLPVILPGKAFMKA